MPIRPARLLAGLVVAAFPAALPPAAAQAPDPAGARDPGPPRWIGGTAEDSVRTAQLLGRAPVAGWLLRSPSDRPGPGGGSAVRPVLPQVDAAWNSAIPLSLNDGSLWAGRGASVRVRGGVRAEWRRVRVTLAPELVRSQNLDFRAVPGEDLERSIFAPPWRRGRLSADLPTRFGERPITRLDPGQSSVVVRLRGAETGLATESQWWGPGIRNAIVLSANAPGFPHVFLRTARPLRVPGGDLEARWIAGMVTESPWFDRDDDNDLRSLGAAAVTFRPSGEPGLTLGAAHAVVTPARGKRDVARAAAHALLRWGTASDSARTPERSVQLVSLFGRWVLAESGAEVYAEWARHVLPSLSDLLEEPGHSQGYTLGLQWVRPLTADSSRLVRLQAEVTSLEQGASYRTRPTASFYTSAGVAQGHTHRGRSLGAAIGPGASSQWVAADLLGRRGRAGAFLGRVRWDNDAFYTTPAGRDFGAHDVSLMAGARGGVRTPLGELNGEVLREWRMNHLFQSVTTPGGDRDAVDVRNLSVRLSFTPGR